jgi:hypothetical protein
MGWIRDSSKPPLPSTWRHACVSVPRETVPSHILGGGRPRASTSLWRRQVHPPGIPDARSSRPGAPGAAGPGTVVPGHRRGASDQGGAVRATTEPTRS